MKRTPATSRRFDSAAQEAYLSLWRTYDRLREIEDATFVPFGITAQQYNVLRLLRAEHPQAVPTLGLISRLISRAPDITRLLDRLETLKLISRTRSEEDRRTVLVGIRPAGLALLDEIEAPLAACHARQLGHLNEEELQSLADLLRRARAPHEAAASEWR